MHLIWQFKDYISNKETKKAKDEEEFGFKHYHFKNKELENLKGIYLTKNEMIKETEYYTDTYNSTIAGTDILSYIAVTEGIATKNDSGNYYNINREILDVTAGKWSGSANSIKFGQEIEAHADLHRPNSIVSYITAGGTIVIFKKGNVEAYNNSVGMADLATGDAWAVDKIMMDYLWIIE